MMFEDKAAIRSSYFFLRCGFLDPERFVVRAWHRRAVFSLDVDLAELTGF
jgi:hypothetical protein